MGDHWRCGCGKPVSIRARRGRCGCHLSIRCCCASLLGWGITSTRSPGKFTAASGQVVAALMTIGAGLKRLRHGVRTAVRQPEWGVVVSGEPDSVESGRNRPAERGAVEAEREDLGRDVPERQQRTFSGTAEGCGRRQDAELDCRERVGMGHVMVN